MRRSARVRDIARFSLLAAVTFYPAWFLAAGASAVVRREDTPGFDWMVGFLLYGIGLVPLTVLGADLVQVALLWMPQRWPRWARQGIHVAAGLIVFPLLIALLPGMAVRPAWEGSIALLAGLGAWVRFLPRAPVAA